MYELIGEEPENKKMDTCIFTTFTGMFICGIYVYVHYY